MLLRRTPLLLLLLASCKLGENHAILPSGGELHGDKPDASTGKDGAVPNPGDGDGDGDGDADGEPDDAGSSGGKDGSSPEPDDSGQDNPHDAGDGDGDDPCGDSGLCTPPAGCTAERHGSHVYFFCTDKLVWTDARAACQAAGTDLVILDSDEENAFVTSHLGADSWTGLNDRDTEGTMLWIVPGEASVSGAPLGITPPWESITGNDNCTVGINLGEQDCVLLTTGGKWNDHGCNAGDCAPGLGADTYGGHRAYVCESY